MFQTGNARDPIDLSKLYAAKKPLGYSSYEDPSSYQKETSLDDPCSDIWLLKKKSWIKKKPCFVYERDGYKR